MNDADQNLARWKEKLASFLNHNPEARLELDGESACIIVDPWGDDSLSIRVSDEAEALSGALQSLRLPPRLSAVWHLESGDMEFIFAPLAAGSDLRSREFAFSFAGTSYKCAFGDASPALESVANAVRPAGPPTSTNHRNLVGLRSFLRFRQRGIKRGDQPFELVLTSFWVRKVRTSEDQAVEMLRHLNFFMRYFDRRSPVVLIHGEPVTEQVAAPARFPHGPFPEDIIGRELDPHLLDLWHSAEEGPDPVRNFLYCYHILEYCAFYFLKEEAFRAIRRVVAAPDALSRVDDIARALLDIVAEDRTSDEAKMTAIIQQAVEPAAVWAQIEPRVDYFSSDVEFDGGFVQPALIRPQWTLDDFKGAWIPKLPDSLRYNRKLWIGRLRG